MAARSNVTWTSRRRASGEDVCPVNVKSLRTDQQTSVVTTDRKSVTGSFSGDRTHLTHLRVSPQVVRVMGEEAVAKETSESSDDELGRLDIDLNMKSRQHNLTSSNVRAILHEVITHEHVVLMMKAAIRDTQDLPLFEPKMTRSRLKQAVQEGQPLSWSLSAVNTVKRPQFVDIDLEEDSSDEEYCPDEEEDEEEEEGEDTPEETLLSDADSFASPLRVCQPRRPADQRSPGHQGEQLMTIAPAESSFLERLNAVEEELDCGPTYTLKQSLDRKADDDDDDDDEGCLAFRTRSKLRLVNVPLGQLEAELLAPDITADMYDLSAAQGEEERHWTKWLHGLMASDNEEEADDDDDPEYNFLDDMDEPDLEDYRTDRAVQITKREVNELLDELFDTLQEEEEEEEEVAAEGREEEEAPSTTGPKFNVPQALRFEAPLAGMLTEQRRTFRKQYEALQQRRALQDTTNHHRDNSTPRETPLPQPILVLPSPLRPVHRLDSTQRLQLQQQIQQHVQLLTQVHLLSRHVDVLHHEASVTKRYLEELQQFCNRREEVSLPSSFRVCNLQGALALLQEVEQRKEPPAAPAASRRWLPTMTPATTSHAFALLPANAAWLLATRPVFLYPELLPVCSLDPALHSQHQRSIYTAGENGLIVLGLKHFEGAFQSDQLISSYLLCKNRWNVRKHVREMSGSRAPPNNVIKLFLTHRVIPPLPLACRLRLGDQCPPVDRNTSHMPNWLKNSQHIIQKTRQGAACYSASLPPGCPLRLHPYYLNKTARPPPPRHRRLFTLAHNASLLPLAKAPADRQTGRQVDRLVDLQPISCLPPVCGPAPLATVQPVPAHPVHADINESCLPIGQSTQLSVSRQLTAPLVLPLPSLSSPRTSNPIIHCSSDTRKSVHFFLQMVLTPPAPPTASSQHALGQQLHRPIKEEDEVEEDERQVEEEEENWTVGIVSMNGGDDTGGEEEEGREGGGGRGGEEEAGGWGGGGQGGGEEEEEEEGQREDGGEEREEEEGEKDKDDNPDRQGEEEEEEEDFDDLTQDEDEEEVMSSASEESVLSVPELQETLKQLTWLAAERRLGDGDSEEDHSPTSPGSQEEEDEEEEEEGPKGEESGDGRRIKIGGGKETPPGEGTSRGGGRCPGRGRGRSRPLCGLRRSRRQRRSKDAAKLLLLFDERILDNDPHRESKDVAFAQSYLSRVREALQEEAGQVEEFVSLLEEFELVGDRLEVVRLFRKLQCILGDRTDLLRDFAAFLHPEQALQCGLWEEQQAFERSRRFLRQLEISFGDNPSHYQKIIKALQTSPDLSPPSIHELKAQMAMLLKGHTHLQAEFWVFFDDLRPPPARPGQFEEAHWPEEGGASLEDGVGHVSGGGASCGFEEVTLPELVEEEEGHKIQPVTGRRQRRKMEAHINYKDCDWSDKDWPCRCRDTKISRHRRKGCSCCHGNKTSGGVSRAMKSLDPLYSQLGSNHPEPGDKYLEQKDQSSASWEASFHLNDEEEEEEEEELEYDEEDEDEEERKNTEEHSPVVKKSRREEALHPPPVSPASMSPSAPPSSSAPPPLSSAPPSSSAPPPLSSAPPSSSVTLSSSAPPFSSAPPPSSFGPPSTAPPPSSSPPSSVAPPSSAPLSTAPPSSSAPPPSTAPPSFSSPPSSPVPPSSAPPSSSASPPSTAPPSSSAPPPSSTAPPPSTPSSSSAPPPSSTAPPPFTPPPSSSAPPQSTAPPSSSAPPPPTAPSSSFSSSPPPSSSALPSSAPPDLPVCAKNISLTASGEKVILWTREADRVILTMCQQEGAKQNTFQAISTLLGNKSPSEVSRRFRDLMRLFRTAARQTSSEDEAPPTEPAAANEDG